MVSDMAKIVVVVLTVDFGGHGSFEGRRGSYGGRHGGFDKRLHQCRHCGKNNHISKKCWEKFVCPEWAQLVDTDSTTAGDIAHAHSSTPSGSSDSSTVILSQAEYN